MQRTAANSEASTPDGVDTDITIILGDLSVTIETRSEPAGEVCATRCASALVFPDHW
jgi:hypothetical protein